MAYLDIKKDSNDQAGRIAGSLKELQESVSRLALHSKREKTIPDPNKEENNTRYARLDALLDWLDTEVEINPVLKQKARLQGMLEIIMCKEPQYHFPEVYKAKARNLLDKWEAENWGAPPELDGRIKVEIVGDADVEDAEEDDDGRVAKRRKTSSTSTGDYSKHPPPDHPIWGREGIMNGLARRINPDTGRFSTVLNPDILHKKRPFTVYGHNGLDVGQWFPVRLSALYYGAHGASQAGISGDTKNGAYSIVVSGAYDELDRDRGDVLYYSGSGSHENEDPKAHAPSTNQTKTLHASLRTQNPVRVLRNKSKHRFAPTDAYAMMVFTLSSACIDRRIREVDSMSNSAWRDCR